MSKEMMDNIQVNKRLKMLCLDFAVNSGLQNFLKKLLKDSADAFQCMVTMGAGEFNF